MSPEVEVGPSLLSTSLGEASVLPDCTGPEGVPSQDPSGSEFLPFLNAQVPSYLTCHISPAALFSLPHGAEISLSSWGLLKVLSGQGI